MHSSEVTHSQKKSAKKQEEYVEPAAQRVQDTGAATRTTLDCISLSQISSLSSAAAVLGLPWLQETMHLAAGNKTAGTINNQTFLLTLAGRCSSR
jgi:hypothetical protein